MRKWSIISILFFCTIITKAQGDDFISPLKTLFSLFVNFNKEITNHAKNVNKEKYISQLHIIYDQLGDVIIKKEALMNQVAKDTELSNNYSSNIEDIKKSIEILQNRIENCKELAEALGKPALDIKYLLNKEIIKKSIIIYYLYKKRDFDHKTNKEKSIEIVTILNSGIEILKNIRDQTGKSLDFLEK
jgi:hypothetical protein